MTATKIDRRHLPRPPEGLDRISARFGKVHDSVLAREVGLSDDQVRYWRLKTGKGPKTSARGVLAGKAEAVPGAPNAWLLACGKRLADMERMSPRSVALLFQYEPRAQTFLENARWPKGIACEECSSAEVERQRFYFRCRGCKAYFTLRTGTVLHQTKIPLRKWLRTLYLLETEPRAVAAHWLYKEIGLTFKTTWMVLKRVQAARLGFTRWSRTNPELTR